MKKTVIVVFLTVFMMIVIIKSFIGMWKTTNVEALSDPIKCCLAARSSLSALENN